MSFRDYSLLLFPLLVGKLQVPPFIPAMADDRKVEKKYRLESERVLKRVYAREYFEVGILLHSEWAGGGRGLVNHFRQFHVYFVCTHTHSTHPVR